ncbi:hypothetical protein HAX54_018107, partial [Datura stramonium]|nr:hypothetical protein [Datura stramonium]
MKELDLKQYVGGKIGDMCATSQYFRRSACLLRPSGPTRGSTGIFTCCPSTTPFGLILGPDSPSVDEPCGGTLRFSGHWILTNVCATQAVAGGNGSLLVLAQMSCVSSEGKNHPR